MHKNGASMSWHYEIIKTFGILVSVAASLIWFATIIALFALWARDSFPQYQPGDGEV
ncbi:unnamed protein product, partial [Rotaria sordida]